MAPPNMEVAAAITTGQQAASACAEHIPAVCPAAYRKLQAGAAEYQSTVVGEGGWGEVRTCASTGHKALHALREYAPGDVLCAFSHRAALDKPNYLTVQVGAARHILLAPKWLETINHSCAPNVFFNTRDLRLKALTPLRVGDELSVFYPSTELSMDAPFECLCGSAACLGTIQGAAHLSTEQRARYRLNAHLHDALNNLAASGGSDADTEDNGDAYL